MKKYILSLCVMMSISIITVAQDTRVIASPMTLITNRIADNGNIGIGTILPSSPLHIRSSINRSLRLDLTGVLATSSYTWQSFFTNSIEQWRVVGRNADNANLEFWNKAGQSTFSLLQNGNVGIGTTTPNKKLEIKGGDGVGIRLFNENANTWDILNSTNGKLDFVRGGTGNFMTIDQIGRVGIGTTNPSSKLDVVGGHISLNDDTAGLPFKLWANGGSGSSTPNHMRLGTDSGHFGDAAMEIYQDYAGGAEQNPGRVVVNGTLSIGIGNNTVVPKQKLEVNGTVKKGGQYENLDTYAGGLTPANGNKIKIT
ncbi:MAG: hypothetical protein HRT69_15605 [Flavobacteriaceae bacterium]|nr:hypothetical protein [Flavobacteriaceae bacterium]